MPTRPPASRLPAPALLLLSCLLAAPPSAARAELPERLVDELLATSVTVSAPDGTGSGCVVLRGGRAYVLTAAHVVEGCRPKAPGGDWAELAVYQLRFDAGDRVKKVTWDAEVVRYEEGEDLAVLLLKDPRHGLKRSARFWLDTKPPRLGRDLAHCGSPFGDFGSGAVVPAWYTAYDRRVEGRSYDYVTCPTYPGSSGGQVTALDGRYVGMVQRGTVGGAILVKPTRRIRKWAKAAGVEFLLDPALPDPGAEAVKKGPIEPPAPKEKSK